MRRFKRRLRARFSSSEQRAPNPLPLRERVPKPRSGEAGEGYDTLNSDLINFKESLHWDEVAELKAHRRRRRPDYSRFWRKRPHWSQPRRGRALLRACGDEIHEIFHLVQAFGRKGFDLVDQRLRLGHRLLLKAITMCPEAGPTLTGSKKRPQEVSFHWLHDVS